MQNEDKLFQALVKKRKALSRWLLLTLVFNVFLQSESIEEFFTQASEASQVIAPMSEVCGPQSELHAASWPHPTIGRAFLLVGFSANSFQFKPLMASEKFQPLNLVKIKQTDFIRVTLIAPKFFSSFSGLSPPSDLLQS